MHRLLSRIVLQHNSDGNSMPARYILQYCWRNNVNNVSIMLDWSILSLTGSDLWICLPVRHILYVSWNVRRCYLSYLQPWPIQYSDNMQCLRAWNVLPRRCSIIALPSQYDSCFVSFMFIELCIFKTDFLLPQLLERKEGSYTRATSNFTNYVFLN